MLVNIWTFSNSEEQVFLEGYVVLEQTPVKCLFKEIRLTNCHWQIHKNFFDSLQDLQQDALTFQVHYCLLAIRASKLPPPCKNKILTTEILLLMQILLIIYCYCTHMMHEMPSSGKNLIHIWFSNWRNT